MTQKKKQTKKKKQVNTWQLDPQIRNYIIGIVVIVLAIFTIMQLGIVGRFIYRCIYFLVGVMSIPLLIVLIIFTLKYAFKLKLTWRWQLSLLVSMVLITGLVLGASFSTNLVDSDLLSYLNQNLIELFKLPHDNNGGIVGGYLFALLSIAFDKLGTYLLLFGGCAIALLLTLTKETKGKIKDFFTKKEVKPVKPKKVVTKKVENDERLIEKPKGIPEPKMIDDHELNALISEQVEEKPVEVKFKQKVNDTLDDSRPIYSDDMDYELPNLSLLKSVKNHNQKANTEYAKEAGKRLIEVLDQFNIAASLVAIHIGPTVTQFEIKPEQGVRVSKIANLGADIKMGLSAKDIRIEAPIPGKNTVGIEIPNKEKTMVSIAEVLSQAPSDMQDDKLLFALGKGLTGESVCGELDKMPHMLIAGATGSGKSVCVNSIIISILMRAKPSEVKLLLIDPKKVEFTPFRDLPHLLGPVITDANEASRALKVIVEMMDRRYDLFSKVGVRNISGYQEYIKKHPDPNLKPMPYVAVIIDELADLMLVAAKDVESSIQRITQLARAAGIHLIVATQRPSVDVITGIIKANIPSRIAFAVSSAVDSRTILDMQGAEQLLGYGDMLYLPRGENSPQRLQGCFVSDEEVMNVANFCANQAKAKYDDRFIRLDAVDRGVNPNGNSKASDPIYEDVKKFVVESGKASTSLIQRKFSLGYARAARLIDLLEEEGIIGPSNGSKPREVYVSSLEEHDN